MILDGDEIVPGDKLYDLLHGFVSVKQVYADSILVKRRTAAGREQLVNYNPAGVASNAARRTLYWADPIVVTPRKDARIWQAQKNMLLNVTAQIGSLLAKPDMLPPDDLRHLTLAEAQSRGLIDDADQAQVQSITRRPAGVVS